MARRTSVLLPLLALLAAHLALAGATCPAFLSPAYSDCSPFSIRCGFAGCLCKGNDNTPDLTSICSTSGLAGCKINYDVARDTCVTATATNCAAGAGLFSVKESSDPAGKVREGKKG